MKRILPSISALLFVIIIGCKSSTNSPEFLEKFSGRYLYTDDEIILVHSKDNKILIDWRGAKNIAPMKISKDAFYVKDMNAKIQFLVNPDDGKEYLVFVPKEKHKAIEYKHIKVADDYKTPKQHFKEGDYAKALEGYLQIKTKDSLHPIIEEWRMNRVGYDYMERKDYKKALEAFKINIAIHPNSANVFDSYAEALYKSGDTVAAIVNYLKVLSMDSSNRHAKRQLKRLQKIDQ